MFTRWLLLLVLVGSSVSGVAHARQGDERLVPLFDGLRTAESDQDAEAMVREIWAIWHDSGSDEVDRFMLQGIRAMNAGLFEIALKLFDKVVVEDPEFAEGWNKRATVHWLLDNLDQSMDDIQRTLSLEPRHFGAVSGMGLIFIERGDRDGALRAFEQVLKINPRDRGARQRMEQIKRLNESESV